jgi:hypothetical protein
MAIQGEAEDSLERILEAPKFDMFALFVAVNTTVVHVLDVAQKRNVLISNNP